MAEVSSSSQPVLPKIQPGDPEYTISLVGLVTSLAGQPLVGLILSAIALKQSKAARRSNTLALLGFIFGIVFAGLGILMVLLYIAIVTFSVIGHGATTF